MGQIKGKRICGSREADSLVLAERPKSDLNCTEGYVPCFEPKTEKGVDKNVTSFQNVTCVESGHEAKCPITFIQIYSKAESSNFTTDPAYKVKSFDASFDVVYST